MAAHRLKLSGFPLLIRIMIVFIVLESTTFNARELRPSDHGLEYYNEPDESSEMTSFFGPPSSNELTSTSSSTSPPSSILPSAVKSPVMSLSNGRNKNDHVLVVGSLVCGLAGLALIIASAFIYFLGHPKSQNLSVNCDQIHTNVNTK